MTAPSIEMIAASLRNCSLEGGREVFSPPVDPPGPAAAAAEEVTVELNSEVALPYHWEQCLDMRTGEIYFINWSDGTRTTEDPRFSGYYPEDGYYSDETSDDSEDSRSEDGIDHNNYFTTDCTTTGDTSSTYSPGEVTSALSEPPVLVAAGCKSCFIYFMVPKYDFLCPKCGGHLLHLGRNGCS